MDELKVKSVFLRNLLKVFLVKKLKKKFNNHIDDISINDLEVTIDDGKLNIHLNLDAKADKEILSDLLLKGD